MINKFNIFYLLCLVITIPVFSQQKGFQLPDSLKDKSYDYLNNRIDLYEEDTIKALFYLDSYLSKAKSEKNLNEMVNAYSNAIFFVPENLKLAYADSIVATAKMTNDPPVIGSAYISKGNFYYSIKNYAQALNFYLLASDYISNSDDAYLKYELKYHIAGIKIHLGFNDEALVLLKECVDYFKQYDEYDYQRGYLNSLHSLGLVYNRLGKYDLSTETNEFALKEAKRLNIDLTQNYIIHSEGINQYFKKNYTKAVHDIQQALPAIIKNNDFANEAVGYFYIGKCYWDQKQHEKALPYFKKVDRTFAEKNYIRPDLRENYELLVGYYKEKGDVKNQLYYINRLMKADSVLNANFKYMSGKIHKEYDTKALRQAKQEIEKQLAGKEKTTLLLYFSLAVFFFLTLYFFYRYYSNQKLYRQKFEELMDAKKEEPQDPISIHKEDTEKKGLDINPDVVTAILKELEKFESRKKFLEKDLTLVNLASAFNTNSNYLSKVINHYRNKNYNTYLNDLRIDYIVDLLKSQSKYRNYTIKALADESGFSTPQHFSKAFFASTGIYPSYFLNELNKERDNVA
ncbi:AraC family transcriptional regulator [Flavobacterium sp. WW92]|uniref:AraC family transcriptional regulator n=1 Tax=unclassified Flavobacterium TaxID=196869 RepID=UPI0022259B90|nr:MULTISPECIES: AraC family transcriptional regulator [unclassified Flavobacterium]WDO14046.1 AraC family transcriptional regulator [Flavobacterium sp. WW92]